MDQLFQQSEDWRIAESVSSILSEASSVFERAENVHNRGALLVEDCIDPRWLSTPTGSTSTIQQLPIRSPIFTAESVDDAVTTELRAFDENIGIPDGEGFDVDACVPGVTGLEQLGSVMTEPPKDLPHSGTAIENTPIGDIYVKKGEQKCPVCGRNFVGGAAAIRKHIKIIHLQQERMVGRVLGSRPGRAKNKVQKLRTCTSTRNIGTYDELAKKRFLTVDGEESTDPAYATYEELYKLRYEILTLQQVFCAFDTQRKIIAKQHDEITLLLSQRRERHHAIIEAQKDYFFLQSGGDEFLLHTMLFRTKFKITVEVMELPDCMVMFGVQRFRLPFQLCVPLKDHTIQVQAYTSCEGFSKCNTVRMISTTLVQTLDNNGYNFRLHETMTTLHMKRTNCPFGPCRMEYVPPVEFECSLEALLCPKCLKKNTQAE